MVASLMKSANFNISPIEVRDSLRVSFVGNFYNHGVPLAQWATGFVLLLSKIKKIEEVNVLCPSNTEGKAEMQLPEGVRIIPCFDIEKPLTLINLLKELSKGQPDIIFFNLNSTSFGNKSLTNLIGLLITFLAPLFGKRYKIIYHSSVITNDPEKLGYNKPYDKLRRAVLSVLEFSIFRFLDTFVLLDTYKTIIDKSVRKNKVKTLKNHYLEALPTIFMNGFMEQSELKKEKTENTLHPTILLPGSWGPQKNLELALKSLNNLRKGGYSFRVVITGGPNSHFADYANVFDRLISQYGDIITESIGYIAENEMMKIFLNSDLILMPYNTSGGHSGILEMAAFFEVPLIGISFAEYEEKKKELNSQIVLTSNENFEKEIQKFLETWNNTTLKSIRINEKMDRSVTELDSILDM